jgi:hypothetical protein
MCGRGFDSRRLHQKALTIVKVVGAFWLSGARCSGGSRTRADSAEPRTQRRVRAEEGKRFLRILPLTDEPTAGHLQERPSC